MNDTRLQDIGAAYRKLDEQGNLKVITITAVIFLWEVKILLFPNKRKESENHPDYRVCLEVEKKRRSQPQNNY